jgi:hypothetical protein
MSVPDPHVACEYNIASALGGRRVSVDPLTHNIRVWGPLGLDRNQRWFILPVGTENGVRYKLVSRHGNELATVHPGTGWLVLWKELDGDKEAEQLFWFTDPSGGDPTNANDWWRIRESTRREYVTRTSLTDDVRRWKSVSGADRAWQYFRLEPVNSKPRPPRYTSVTDEVAPSRVPDPPEFMRDTDPDRHKEESAHYLIGELIVSTQYIKDDAFGDVFSQLDNRPYYHILRYRYWERQSDDHIHAGKLKLKLGLKNYMSQEHARTQEVSTGTKTAADGGVKFEIGLGDKFKVSPTANIKTEWQESLKVVESLKTVSMTETTYTVDVEWDVPVDGFLLIWQPVDLYRLYLTNKSGTLPSQPLEEWKVYPMPTRPLVRRTFVHKAEPLTLALAELAWKPAGRGPDAVDINFATERELEKLRHIGRKRAAQISFLRPFTSVDDLVRVRGIGPIRLKHIKAQDLACVAHLD